MPVPGPMLATTEDVVVDDRGYIYCLPVTHETAEKEIDVFVL